MIDTNVLKPCPFCGAQPHGITDHHYPVLGNCTVQCSECAASVGNYNGTTKAGREAAVWAWNRRAALGAPPVAEERTVASVRAAFEAWVKSPPYERLAERLPDDPDQTAWPGQYRCPDLQLAWEAWQAALAAVDGGQAHA